MYTYIYTYIYIYIYIYVNICTYIPIVVHAWNSSTSLSRINIIQVTQHIHKYIYTSLHICIHVYTCIFKHVPIVLHAWNSSTSLSRMNIIWVNLFTERVFLNIYNNQNNYDMLIRYIYSRQGYMKWYTKCFMLLYSVFNTHSYTCRNTCSRRFYLLPPSLFS
jgi:hypothetical protein